MQNIGQGVIRNLWVAQPTVAEQATIFKAIVAETGSLDTALRCAEIEISQVMEYRTRLVADVVTGQVDVREAVRNLPAEVDAQESAIAVHADDETDELLETVEDHG